VPETCKICINVTVQSARHGRFENVTFVSGASEITNDAMDGDLMDLFGIGRKTCALMGGKGDV
jgi:hypothetical protein